MCILLLYLNIVKPKVTTHCARGSRSAREPAPMSIRLIAKDLYELIRKVENLEKEIDNTPYENQSDMKDQLRKLRAEKNHMRKVLEGCKDSK